uniref:Uncharacterized protein n=1 Tax=Anopheles arabiensis TaxID=7173 RepID=A0A182HYY2_ANOAR
MLASIETSEEAAQLAMDVRYIHAQGVLLYGARIPTKREVLRTLMLIYDPLGLFGNFLMFITILLQEIWRLGYSCDKPIDSVMVPRFYCLITSAATPNIQLHVFCDASEYGMAAVAYFRFEEDNAIECALIGSKTRVTPLKFLSIPRLKLQAAVIGARLATSIASSHRLKIGVFWTDSGNMISWLKSDHRKYNPFVVLRVSELLEKTDVNEWRWLSTKANVANEGMKWQKISDMSPSSIWFRGPSFIWKSEDEWPAENPVSTGISEELRLSAANFPRNS